MPKQSGGFKINGTIDDTTFYERNGAFFARSASKGPTKQEMLTSSRYARTRENMSEFGALAVTAKSLTSALNKATEFRDSTLRQRLMSATRSIMGATHVRFVQLLGIVSNTVFDETLKKHISANCSAQCQAHTATYSDYLSLKSPDVVNVQLQHRYPTAQCQPLT